MADATIVRLDRSDPIDIAELLQLFGQYQAARGLARKTVERRFYSLRRLATFVAPVPLLEVDPQLLEQWLAGYGNAETRHAYLADARQLFRWAHRRGLVGRDPTADIDSVVRPQPLPAPIGETDWRAAADSADPRTRLVLLFGALAGLRRAEIAAMRREDCTERRIMVRRGKGGRGRVIPTHPALWAAIDAYEIKRGWLFPSRTGWGHAGAGTIGGWVRRHFDDVGIASSLHKTRHRFGTGVAEESHGNVWAVKTALGHARLASAEHYVQFDPSALEHIIRRLSA